jgi:hypothetical protein
MVKTEKLTFTTKWGSETKGQEDERVSGFGSLIGKTLNP